MKSILLTCPTVGRIHHATAQVLSEHEPLYVLGPRGIDEARNRCRELALSNEVGCLLMVDDDVQPHPAIFWGGMDPILDKKADIVAFPCPVWRQGTLLPNIYKLREGADLDDPAPPLSFYLELPRAADDGLVDIDACGFGCVAISANCLRKVGPFATYKDEKGLAIQGEDIDYCLRARRLGLRVACNPTLFCEHMLSVPGSQVAQSLAQILEGGTDEEESD